MIKVILFLNILLAGVAPWNSKAHADVLDEWEYVEPSTAFSFQVKRFEANPIIHREMTGMIGKHGRRNRGPNFNGPSLIQVPDWIENPLGRYYLYFAHHHGSHIRMAYANRLEGPWRIYGPGVLQVEETPAYDDVPRDHVASPDVHVDHERKKIRMYYHGDPRPGWPDAPYQMSYVARSSDGLEFESLPDPLGSAYFRVFEHQGWHYALAKDRNVGGIMYRSRDGLGDFEEGPTFIPRVRHMAVWKHGSHVYVFFSRIGDTPEHILVSRIENLDDDWADWRFSEPRTVMKPEMDFEGVNQPVEVSTPGSTYAFAHQLRDPAVFVHDGRVYLLYSTAGEWAIGISEIRLVEETDLTPVNTLEIQQCGN